MDQERWGAGTYGNDGLSYEGNTDREFDLDTWRAGKEYKNYWKAIEIIEPNPMISYVMMSFLSISL